MKILVLSNDEMERTIIRQVVQHSGHEVINVGTSEDALQQIKESGVRFVIVDRNSTDVDEKQFIKRLREAQSSHYIYIILIASKIQDMDITVPRGGADDYLHKPLVPLELKSRVFLGQRMLGLDDNLVNIKEALEKSAMFDPLTNTLNEAAVITLARGELERSRRGQTHLSLIALKIENFKEFSDKYGLEVANDVLVLIAQVIREKSRPYDNVGRFDEDVFLIPLPGVISQDAEKIASRIIKGVLSTNISLLDGTAVNVSLSTGIVSSSRITVAMEIESWIEKAREAVSRSHQDGDGQIFTIFI